MIARKFAGVLLGLAVGITVLPAAFFPRKGSAQRAGRGFTPSADGTCEGLPGGCYPSRFSGGSDPNRPTTNCCATRTPGRVAAASLLSGASVASLISPAQEAGGYLRIRVANGPAWAHWGVWDISEGALLLADVSSHSIFHFGLSSGIVKQVNASEFDSGLAVNPSTIRPDDSGYILQDTTLGRLLWLDKSYSQTHFLQLKNFDSPATGTVGSARAWLATKRTIFVLADVKAQDKGSARLLKLQVPDPAVQSNGNDVLEIKPASANIVFQWTSEEPVRRQAILQFPVMATAKGRGFILLNGDSSSHISEMGDGLRPLATFPAGYERFPLFPSDMPGKLLPEAYGLLESSQTAVALYGHGDFLYLLLRRPDAGGTGETVWSVAKIDPDPGTVVETLTLPSRSPNLFLAGCGNRGVRAP